MKEQDKNKLSVNCLLSDRRATMVKRAVMIVWALSIIIFFADSSVFSQVLTERAAFAGGCFWCMEATFEETEGVIEAVSGYTGGETIDPSYEEVSAGKTGHYEAVEVEFNPTIISYAELLKVFWQNINPTDSSGQFYDRGGSV